jgi:hypothetical protein
MPRNGSGQYNLPSGINPVVTQTLITSNWANTTMQDIANALTQSLARDGQTTPTANLPMGGFRFTGAGDPVGSQDFMTLSYAQQGQQTRLTNVAGVNDITANLPGGLQTFAVGQLVQLVPFATNTGPVTISINGAPPAAIVSATGGPLAATNLRQGQVYLLSYNGTAWNVLTSPDITGWVQAAISGWDRPQPSGVYPPVTQVNANTIAIPAGAGRIIKPSTRDITGVTEVTWAAQNYVLQNIANAWETTIGINAAGQVVEFNGNVNAAWARSAILLCTVGHVNGTIQFISNKPLIFGDVAYMAYDLGILFHNTLIKGGRMTGNIGNPLHIDIAAGTLWVVGGAANQSDSPNYLNFPNMPNINFWPVSATNVVGAVTQTAPVGSYDPAGTGVVTPIPGGGANTVIHRLWLLAGQIIWTYGQIVYANLDTAVAALDSDNTFFIPPPKLADATLIGYIIARKDCINLNDFAAARLLSAADAGGASGGGGGGGVPEAPINGSTYGRNNGAWVFAVDTVQAGANVTVNNANPNKPLVAVPSSNLVAGEAIILDGVATNRLLGTGGNLTVVGTETFRNKLINGDFDIWQRAISAPLAVGGATIADRWTKDGTGTQHGVAQLAFGLGQTEVPDNPVYFWRSTTNSVAGANNYALINQSIEDVRTFQGQNIVLSFYAKSPNAPRPISVELSQQFGAGGSPSPEVTGIGATKVNLTTNWQKFSIPMSVPSVAGKSFGTNGRHCLRLFIWLDAGATYNSRTVSLGQFPGIQDIDIAHVQIEKGSIATQFEKRLFGIEMALCERYYEKSYALGVYPGAVVASGSDIGRVSGLLSGLPSAVYIQGVQVTYKTRKFRTPSVVAYSHLTGAQNRMVDTLGVDIVSTVATGSDTGCFIHGTQSAPATNANVSCHWTADAEI